MGSLALAAVPAGKLVCPWRVMQSKKLALVLWGAGARGFSWGVSVITSLLHSPVSLPYSKPSVCSVPGLLQNVIDSLHPRLYWLILLRTNILN